MASHDTTSSLYESDDHSFFLECLDHIVTTARSMPTVWWAIEYSGPEGVIWGEVSLILSHDVYKEFFHSILPVDTVYAHIEKIDRISDSICGEWLRQILSS